MAGKKRKRVIGSIVWSKRGHHKDGTSGIGQASTYHALVIIFLEFFAWGLLTSPVISILNQTFPKHTFLMNGLIQGVKGMLSFLSAPLIGALSDVFGRKPFLILTVTFTCAPIPLMHLSVWWYFAMLSISGIFSVTFSVVFAFVADVTTDDDRSSAYGLVSATFAASLVTSPALGAYLQDLYSDTVVIWIATAVAVLDVFFIMVAVPESLPEKLRPASWGSAISWEKADPFGALRKVSQDQLILLLCTAVFLSYLPEAGEYSSIFVYLKLVMHFTTENVASYIAMVGILSVLAQTVLMSALMRYLGHKRAIMVGLIFEIVQLSCYGFATQTWILWVAGCMAAMSSITYPAISSFVSAHASSDQQGVAQGIVTGIRGLCNGLGPALFGFIFYLFHVNLNESSDLKAEPAKTDNSSMTLLQGSLRNLIPGPPFAFGVVLVIMALIVAAFIPENPSTTFRKLAPSLSLEAKKDPGLVPRVPFLRVDSDVNTLVYFDVKRDASKITWARSTNSREALQKAVMSNVHMIEGNIILQGQGTPHQKLVPVMGQPDDTASDFQLVDWLDGIRYRNKGIKLDFSTIDAVEIALQRLREFNALYPVRVPVWVHADVLPGPHGGKVKVDPSRFFQILKREFPKCTLSLGWTTGTHTDLSQSGYSWDMVMDMYELVKKWKIEDQPIVFEARLSLIRNSVPQLKWLCDNVKHSALNVVHVERDVVLGEDVMYISYRFPPEGVFFDLNHQRFDKMLTLYRHFSQEKVSHLVLKRDEVMFRHKAWLKMGFYIQKDSLLPSTESFILTTPIVYIASKAHNKPSPHVYVQGRVKFLNRNKAEAEPFSTGLNIYTRPTSYVNFEHIVGIKCFIGVDGDVEVKGSDMPENVPSFRKTARITPSVVSCFRFRVTDTGDQVIFQVSAVHDCHTLESVVPEDDMHLTLTVDIPPMLAREANPFIVRLEDNQRQAVIDELSIQHKME